MRRDLRGRKVRTIAVFATVGALLLAGCSGDDGDKADPTTTSTTVGSSTPPTTGSSAEKLHILVSNDDGYAADGIDALVQGLGDLDDVDVVVVAPLEQQSGQGGRTTLGPLPVTDVTTKSGYPAKAVAGFPADSVRVALDELKVEADVVITGINAGQNLGPILDVSGTVGAARAAVARGIPALAVSQGSGAPEYQYEVAVPEVLDWVRDHRDQLLDGKLDPVVTNLNVPSCAKGQMRGLAEVPTDPTGDATASIGPQDCASTVAFSPEMGEVEAFVNGYATINEVPAEPKTPADVYPAGGATTTSSGG